MSVFRGCVLIALLSFLVQVESWNLKQWFKSDVYGTLPSNTSFDFAEYLSSYDNSTIYIFGKTNLSTSVYKFSISKNTIISYDTSLPSTPIATGEHSFHLNDTIYWIDTKSRFHRYQIPDKQYTLLYDYSVFFHSPCICKHPSNQQNGEFKNKNSEEIIYFIDGSDGRLYQLNINDAIKMNQFDKLTDTQQIGLPDTKHFLCVLSSEDNTSYLYQVTRNNIWQRIDLNYIKNGFESVPVNLVQWNIDCFGKKSTDYHSSKNINKYNYNFNNHYKSTASGDFFRWDITTAQHDNLIYIISYDRKSSIINKQIAWIDVDLNYGNCSQVEYVNIPDSKNSGINHKGKTVQCVLDFS